MTLRPRRDIPAGALDRRVGNERAFDDRGGPSVGWAPEDHVTRLPASSFSSISMRMSRNASQLLSSSPERLGHALANCPQTRTETKAGGLVLLEHPEDLGRAKAGGIPGSIWRWKSLRRLAEWDGVDWGALAQLTLGAPTVKPTRLLTNLPDIKNLLHLGPPQFSGDGRYVGPLPFTQAPGGPLIGKVNNVFRTNSAAAWPPEMCLKVSNAIMDELDITSNQKTGRGS